ncbi:MAG: radical SAM protein, partial [Myxococcales bacterium]|nr:radical SAM protein [Myxococcales bacterium]
MSTSVAPFDLARAQTSSLLPFNFRKVGDSYFMANEIGEHAIVTAGDFKALVEGDLSPDGELYRSLRAKGFVAGGITDGEYRERYWARRAHVMHGPILHAMVLTERCNFGCQYCHSSIVGMKRTDTDMSIATAEKSVDFAFNTPSSGLTIEFQGGEPLANWEVLQHVVAYARDKNRSAQKALSFSLVTNMSLMTDEKLDYLIENRVQICTSIDGPRDLHNRVRIYKEGDSWELSTGWLRKVNQRYKDLGLDPNLYHAEALPTITRHSLDRWKEVVDTYVDLGCRAVFLRVLDP